jgi:hypothetical protein
VGVFVSGDIVLNEEYCEYKWVPIVELDNFEPKVGNVPDSTRWALLKLARTNEEQFVEI